MRAGLVIAMLMLASTAPPDARAEDASFGADGYRIAHYRAPVDHPPEGIVRIAPAAVAALRPDVDALFIDVLPAEGGYRLRECGEAIFRKGRRKLQDFSAASRELNPASVACLPDLWSSSP